MPEPRIQIVVEHADHQTRYYQVPPGGGWKVDPAYRCLVVGSGGRSGLDLPRTYIQYLDERGSAAAVVEAITGEAIG